MVGIVWIKFDLREISEGWERGSLFQKDNWQNTLYMYAKLDRCTTIISETGKRTGSPLNLKAIQLSKTFFIHLAEKSELG